MKSKELQELTRISEELGLYDQEATREQLLSTCSFLRQRIRKLEEEAERYRKPCLHCGRSHKAE
jgi:hypothetical protein